MKIANVLGLMVASLAAASFGELGKPSSACACWELTNFTAAVLNLGAHEKVVAALAARDLSLDEINNIINLMPRQEPVTVTVVPNGCPPYGTLPTSTPAVPTVPLTTEVTVTSSVTSMVTTITPTAPVTPTSVASSETPVETPIVPPTPTLPTVETTLVPPTPPVESSVPATSESNTPTPSENSSVVGTTSSSTVTQTSLSTSSTQTTATATTSTGIPQAPNSGGAGTVGVNLGLAGLMAVLAVA
ncbi:uncharacterized protein A1O5_09758 [Cladophialophora psammophila CBS 110553]|uniref:Uncharacterized protein n=1 Tax=Cladophialophora psammophila CBS 110553 TaxID=1182543 RepID=W9WR09_9EURO|nr:uncharacterized protein A1O5_09758 [Cladophialophora psammophila CBS 110553]EXJ67111.1 hypothetical protein A1O5_09758 [Cladophialophora psammophila CBS 110553]